LESVPCNLCGSSQLTPVYEMPDPRYSTQEIFTVVECDRCGLGFVNPRPTTVEIQKYYPPEYYQNPSTASFDRYIARRFTAEAKYLKPLENGAGKKRLLDVGCANGDFPRFMAARGWEVEGVEVSGSSQRILDFPVYTQEFQDIPMNRPVYDAVTAWAVLEHVHDPMAYFRKASQVITKGGLFVFLVTNFHSTASRYLFCEDIPRHLYFFTRETVREYLQKTGFALLKEENGRKVYKMAPENWLAFMLQTKLRGKRFTYKDIPLSSREFRRVHQVPNGILAALNYLAYSPTSVVNRLFIPAIEMAQILRNGYGISTYVARKL
jgi:cyclopropane fatty-acyl-phospholipid synthase-like methyltransferase